MADKILEVKNLKISFRTSAGVLKAVRDVSFDLLKGETLAIVGESGSGKSVTTKAVLGILAGNSIIEGGEILYDGKDLLTLPEEEFNKIRGDEISMIFQDPLSSLNPIVKIGPQIVEAMLLKNKTSRKVAKKEFNNTLKLLTENMKEACPNEASKIDGMSKEFDRFCIESNKLEASYNNSSAAALSLSENIENFLYMASKEQKQDVKLLIKEDISLLKRINDEFYTVNHKDKINELSNKISNALKNYKPKKDHPEFVNEDLIEALKETEETIKEIQKQTKPEFFRIGFYKLKNPNANLHSTSVDELNETSLKYLDDNFMKEYIGYIEKGLKHSYEKSLNAKKEILPELRNAESFYKGEYSSKEALSLADSLAKKMEGTIDKLELEKDTYAYTFGSSLKSAIKKYFYYANNNPKEEKRYQKQSKKKEELLKRGKTVDWSVIPMNLLDLEELKNDTVKIVSRIDDRYTKAVEETEMNDFNTKAINVVDYFKKKASDAVNVVTDQMAREKAIKLMEEVGIPEPRMRYNQYPFEFSGGMRQRIVIAIALAADPEILICDEPTTALDVTIQAQILELINNLKKERNLSVIFITHDLGVVAQMADNVAVMYAGKIVEYGTADDVYYDPRHPYTWALLSSMPDLDTKEKLEAIPGTPPNMIYPPKGDAFADRNRYAMQIDYEQQPPMFKISDTHSAATWLLHEDAPKVEIPKQITERIARMKARGKNNEQ